MYEITDNSINPFKVKISRFFSKSRPEQELSKIANRIISLITLLLVKEKDKLFFKLKLADLEGFFESHGGNNRKRIIAAIEELKKTTINFYNKLGIKTVSIAFIKDYTYDTTTNEIILEIDPLAPEVIYLTEYGYTNINWIYTFSMKSKYGQKIYEIFMSESWKLKDYPEISIKLNLETLRAYTGTVDKYPNKNHFINRVIKPALDDINEFTQLNAELKVVRDYFEFIIKKKNNTEFFNVISALKKNDRVNELLYFYNNSVKGVIFYC